MKLKLKKILTWLAIGTVIIAGLIAVLSILKIKIDIGQKGWFTLLAILVGSILALTPTSVMDRTKLAIISLILIAISELLFLIIIWTGSLDSTFGKFTGIISILSVLISIIISSYAKLGNGKRNLQKLAYGLYSYIALSLILLILGTDILIKPLGTIYYIIVVVTLVVYVILNVLGKNAVEEEREFTAKDKITISREEYENMKNEIARLKTILLNNNINE